MALGRIPLIAFEIVEYQLSERVLRQFGILQYIPEDPIDMSFLRTERVSSFQRDNHTKMHRLYVREWDSFVNTGMPITGKGQYVLEYMQWFRRVSKLRIVPFVVTDPQRIWFRDWYPRQDMADALESAMRLVHAIHLRGAPDWFYDDFVLPNFICHYDQVNTEWKGLAFSRPAFLKPQPPHVVEQPPLVVEQPFVSQAPSQMVVDPNAHTYSLQTPLLVSQKRPHDDVETSGLQTPLHVSHKRPRGDANIEIQTYALDPLLETPTSTSHAPIHARVFIQDMTIGPDSLVPTPASLPTVLRDHFDMDTNEDMLKDTQVWGGRERSGDLTRPLKNRKIRWLYRSWWSAEEAFEWMDHGGRVTNVLIWKQVQTLKPLYWLQDDVLNAYLELVKIMDFDLFGQSPSTKKYFFAPSFFFHRAMFQCPDLQVHPDAKTFEEFKGQIAFYEEFKGQYTGPDLVNCDYAFFPSCSGSHWILFIVDLKNSNICLVDPLNEDKDYPLQKMYLTKYYIMVLFIFILLCGHHVFWDTVEECCMASCH